MQKSTIGIVILSIIDKYIFSIEHPLGQDASTASGSLKI